ncbi:ORF6N domain-containing protein, partial [Clostridioides difficile]|nr:ORF6N domain-containing protein [Clostridioides difficile]MBY2749406.1 ORF6N domain-containing protein [Clostridioides difficile]MDO8206126.1 ORF6N domain-containing protein [Clostridioides difficile]
MNENINKEITVLGTLEVEGMEFHNIEGGFGENKKAMSVKDIAKIHNRELKHVNELINNNIKRFKDGIDILDLKVSRSERLG